MTSVRYTPCRRQIKRHLCSFLYQRQLWADSRSLFRRRFRLVQNTELILVDNRQCVPVRRPSQIVGVECYYSTGSSTPRSTNALGEHESRSHLRVGRSIASTTPCFAPSASAKLSSSSHSPSQKYIPAPPLGCLASSAKVHTASFLVRFGFHLICLTDLSKIMAAMKLTEGRSEVGESDKNEYICTTVGIASRINMSECLDDSV